MSAASRAAKKCCSLQGLGSEAFKRQAVHIIESEYAPLVKAAQEMDDWFAKLVKMRRRPFDADCPALEKLRSALAGVAGEKNG